MAEQANQKQRPWFFNLKADGDNAVVRLLHSNPSTINIVDTHRIEVDGKKKRIKCLKDGCPFCNNGNNVDTRMFIHLYDYTDDKEKVWDRTDKILPQIEQLFEDWKPLNSAVVKITRVGNEFPKYLINPVNTANYHEVDKSLVDEDVSRMFYMNRKAEDINVFLSTGKFPERSQFVSKEEYQKQKQTEQVVTDPLLKPANEPVYDDPFMTSTTSKPRRV